MWLTLKTLHVATAAISIGLFVLRGWWRFTDPALLQPRWVRVAPHINDTLLLLSALALMVLTAQYPGPQGWLTAKVLGLVVYIVLGMLAFRFAPGERAQRLAWLSAVAVFAYIVAVAVTRTPWVFGSP